ncbi:transcriptional regulator [Paenibacillus rhizovicinus]|uniref:Transcriptional regulator n=1 Tax=Paenibacillus rhizovicinus TaxID=2704463 RepID=A0A6C0P1Q3_9BACL|nr:Rrf2 family transcriptional regulator [Paenibacillus rhizovicinus]QHW32470.1 transcriptional regulator [Paenibacillus rhizovicinus]
MAISSRFSVAVHVLCLLDVTHPARLTSERIAGSVNTNPVVIRRMMGMLSKAGLIRTTAGVAGAELTRDADRITLLDVYRAVRQEQQEGLFSLHEDTNPACRVGRHITSALEDTLAHAQTAMEAELAKATVKQVAGTILQREVLEDYA